MRKPNRLFEFNTLLPLTLLTASYWGVALFLNVYKYALVGVIFELLWLPMCLMVVVLPILYIVYFIKLRSKKNPA